MAERECARTVEELISILRKRGYELRLDNVLYLRRGDECIEELATPWVQIYRRYSRDGDAWYVVYAWYEALAEEIGRWLEGCEP